jgi:hypothetical protein
VIGRGEKGIPLLQQSGDFDCLACFHDFFGFWVE